MDGKWRTTNASANAIPALPNCPLTPPVHGAACGVSSPCGTFPLDCTWLLPECQVPVTGSCLQGTWRVSTCQTNGAGGAGGEGAGGEGGADGLGGDGGVEGVR